MQRLSMCSGSGAFKVLYLGRHYQRGLSPSFFFAHSCFTQGVRHIGAQGPARLRAITAHVFHDRESSKQSHRHADWHRLAWGFPRDRHSRSKYPSQLRNIVYASFGALFFSFYIILDTQLIIGGKHSKFRREVCPGSIQHRQCESMRLAKPGTSRMRENPIPNLYEI